ncbi:hypothetical protein MNEG_7931 [Monoraphidium neglectum]|uniref:Uncharacterized protein n=1 Tax=Monoraphidium neglectum TaxID=145388 RepID=A0A0D2KXN2_9CHLO|nr:hypothetical protein MNEG_7931 [Monoraphidium neglectum]KIZ00029.1 hypothetical protein MNEG_7931 [Monoraphidium neglectum]|eukprot:XP_013899048.1 hypothetical protein MNEG_7931 [Monoraphidium neglectum]
MQLPNEELGGALEDGLEAPPEEHPIGGFEEDDLPIEQMVGDGDDEDEDEDLSLAALFARKLAAGDVAPGNRQQQQQQQQHLAPASGPAPPPVPSLLSAMRSAASGGLAAPAASLPPASQPFSIGLDLHLGGLPDGKPIGASASAAAALGPQAPSLWPSQQPAPTAAVGPTAPGGTPQPAVRAPGAGAMVAGAMSAEQLEAEMISRAREQQQKQAAAAADKGGGLLALLKGGAAAASLASPGPQPEQQQQQQQQQRGMPPHGVPGMGMPPNPFPPGSLPPGAVPPGFPYGQLAPHFKGPYGPGPMPGGRPPMMGPGGPMPPNMGPPAGPGQLPPGFNLPPGFPMPPLGPQQYEGQLMSNGEIEHVLRIQFAATHTGDPYVEDYYAQAYRHKYLGGRNAATFAPDALRRDAASGLALRESRHAAVEGLGRFVLSNIRTPKRLMDVSGRAAGKENGAAGGDGKGDGGEQPAAAAAAARLEDEPMLAARILIEDCNANLMRVEDLDRAAAADEAAGLVLDASSAAGAALRRERAALLCGVVASLQLARAPGDGGGDWVFGRVMALPKGRLMLAKALRFMVHPATGRPAPQGAGPRGGGGARQQQQQQQQRRQQVPWNSEAGGEAGAEAAGAEAAAPALWAVLRNARELFGPAVAAGAGARAEGEKRMLAATEALAAAAAEALRRCGAARDPAWLGSVLSALLLRATELGLGPDGPAPDEDGADGGGAPAPAADGAAADEWRAAYAEIEAAVSRHLAALQQAKAAAGAESNGGGAGGAAAAAAASGMPAATLEALRAHAAELAAVPLVRGMVSDHARGEGRERLRLLLLEVAR